VPEQERRKARWTDKKAAKKKKVKKTGGNRGPAQPWQEKSSDKEASKRGNKKRDKRPRGL